MPPRLTNFKAGQISADILRAKLSQAAIARKHCVSKYTVRAIALKGQDWRQAGVRKVKAKRKTSAKRAVMAKRQTLCVRLAKKATNVGGRKLPANPSARSISIELRKVGFTHTSLRTVQRDLRKKGMKFYVRPVHPFDHGAQATKRNTFAKQKMFEKRNAEIFKRLVFVDETFVTSNDYSDRAMWGMSKTATFPRHVQSHNNCKKIMLFAAVGYDYKSQLVIIDAKVDDEGKKERMTGPRYTRDCLSPIKDHLAGRWLVQDGARCHIAKNVREYLARNDVNVVPNWPGYSPDLNPIESIWALLHRRVALLGGGRTEEELLANTKKAWEDIPQAQINNYVMSFERKLRNVIATEGKEVVK